MFGVIISGRPVLTEPQAISQTQFAFAIPSTPTFSHIVVFFLPGTSLPPDTAAAVYVQLPGGNAEFKFLGAIANEKQSAIFKVNTKALRGAGGGEGGNGDGDAMTDDMGMSGAGAGVVPINGSVPTVTVGISVEPATQVAASLQQLKLQSSQTQQLQTQAGSGSSGGELVVRGASTVTTKVLAQRIIKNAYDFLASFGSEVVPLKAFQGWWEKFEKKIEVDPGFLERSDGG
ncbi:hypothetical protein GQ43DRAFT_22209 [Delitschia confertaspora ATCC 74209]|uniref:Hikeshi-like domain-containing protein n=1 Tax=Delitschia confertaspora ATCC 74209 TaxID=1513339 RepID=A0A9P4JLK6_9PLEO|nr:hypothetical protein GQ43DRAFT_22209 [Delitschia confertaspora ATCC 74209]